MPDAMPADLERSSLNPLIGPADIEPSNPAYRVRGAFNPAAIEFEGEILLLMRVAEDVPAEPGRLAVPIMRSSPRGPVADVLEVDEDADNVTLIDTRTVEIGDTTYLTTMSHLRLARSRDGVTFTVDPEPFIHPTAGDERFGVEDARITKIDDQWFINYTAVSGDGWATALAVTDDFVSIERKGLIFHPNNKDVALFPEKINGKYMALHRPNNALGRAAIWHAESPDLLHWGNHRCILRARDTIWEEEKIGGGAPPIRTDAGWLHIYHGKGQDQMYSLWAVLLDLDDPTMVVARGDTPLMVPTHDYETTGFFGNVVFTNGAVERDGDLLIYYGAADESCCLATTTVDAVLATLA